MELWSPDQEFIACQMIFVIFFTVVVVVALVEKLVKALRTRKCYSTLLSAGTKYSGVIHRIKRATPLHRIIRRVKNWKTGLSK